MSVVSTLTWLLRRFREETASGVFLANFKKQAVFAHLTAGRDVAFR